MIFRLRYLSIVAVCFSAAIALAPATHAAAADSAVAIGPTAEEGGFYSLADAPAVDLSNPAGAESNEARKGCPAGIRSCPAVMVGQPCNPNNTAIICSAQANGAFCCLAHAGLSDDSQTQPADASAPSGGGGACCTHQDKTSCAASCQAAGCSNSIAACINLRCSCRCSGCP